MNILLIDDDAETLDNLQSVLEQCMHSCTCFTKPEEALEEYRNKTYDVVITDMRMPVMNGIQLLKNIRLINPEAKVIILTAFLDAETAIAASCNHAYALFNKPLNIISLVESLKRIENGEYKLAPSDSQLLPLNI